MKKILLGIALFMAAGELNAQQYKWGKMFDGTGVATVTQVQVDDINNTFIAGYLNNAIGGSVDLNPGAGTFTVTAGNNTNFMAKYDSNGNFVWGGQFDDITIVRLKLDPSGNPVIAASFGIPGNYADVDINPSPTVVTDMEAYGKDLCIAKYNATSGALVWAKQIQTLTNPTGNYGSIEIDMAGLHNKGNVFEIDNQGNMIICGSFTGFAEFDLNTSWGAGYDAGSASYEFIIKYNSNGDQVWMFTNGITQNSISFGLKSDAAGNVYYIGRYSTGYPTPDPGYDNSIFLTKITNTGTIGFQKEILLDPSSTFSYVSAELSEYARDIRLDNAGNIYIYGKYWHNTDFDPGTGSTILTGLGSPGGHDFLAKYNASGDLIWAKKFGGTYFSLLNGLEISSNNRLITIPNVNETFTGSGVGGDLDMGTGVTNVIGNFIAQYDTAANLLDYKEISGLPVGFAIKDENIYIGGGFSDSIDLNLSAPTGEFVANIGAAYLAKYNQCSDNTHNITTSICQGESYVLGTQTLTATGTYSHNFAVNNCDSTVIVNLTVKAVDTIVTKNNNILTANATGATYQWLNCANNTLIQGATSATFTPATSGNYKVAVTKNGCSDTSNCYNVNITGINQPEFAKQINIFPNPAQDHLYVSYDPGLAIQKMTLTDMAGRILQSANITDRSGKIIVDVQQFQSGVYLLKLQAGNEKATFKFVKE